MLASGFQYTFLVKKEWFFWPVGPIIKALGAFPVNRGKGAANVVDQVVELYNSSDKVCVGFPPEGTRSLVTKYKTGYLRTAYAAKVPVFICAFDGPNKEVVLDRLFPLTGDLKADNDALKAYVDDNWIGVHPERQK